MNINIEVLCNQKTQMYSAFNPHTGRSMRLVYTSAMTLQTLYPGIVKTFPDAKAIKTYKETTT